MLAPWKESYDQPRQRIKKQRHYFANKGPSSQGYGFSSGHDWMGRCAAVLGITWVGHDWATELNWMYGCETWTLKKTVHQRTDAFELWRWRRLSGSPLDCKEMKLVNNKGIQSWIFFGRTDVEAEAPILWPPDVKCQLIGKDPDAGKDWRQEKKGMTEDEMVGWHHWLNGHKFEQTLGDSERQGSLARCSPQSRKYHYSVFFKNVEDTFNDVSSFLL